MKIKAEEVIQGKLTAKKLREILALIPDNATVKITQHSDQRDGDSSVIFAEWDPGENPGPAISVKPQHTGFCRESRGNLGCSLPEGHGLLRNGTGHDFRRSAAATER